MTTTNATRLKPGDRIHAEGINWLTVTDVLALPDDDVEVDVQPEMGADIWDMDVLAHAAGAHAACWLQGTGSPRLRYRLYYGPTVDVEIEAATEVVR